MNLFFDGLFCSCGHYRSIFLISLIFGNRWILLKCAEVFATVCVTAKTEHDAAQGGHTSLINNLASGLFNAVAKCADQIVSLVEQLVSNQRSNLTESNMSIRCMMDGASNLTKFKVATFSIVALPPVLQQNTVQIGLCLSGRLPTNKTQGLCLVLIHQQRTEVGTGLQMQTDCGIQTAKEKYSEQK